MLVKPWFWMRLFWYCPLDRLHRILFSGIKCFQHHFCKPFSIATLFLANLARKSDQKSDQIHFMDTALVQRVSVLKITLTNIFCSHIFNLYQVVFIDWFSICTKRNVAASNNNSYPKVFFFPYQKVPMKASYRVTCVLVECLNLISVKSKCLV